jgi:hypothetical protein
VTSQDEVLAALGRTRVFVHVAPAEASSRVSTEARAMGAVTVVLGANPFAEPLDGVVAVDSEDDLAGVVAGLLAELAEHGGGGHEPGIESARAEVAWAPYVERVATALDAAPAPDPGRAARAGLGAALRAEAEAEDEAGPGSPSAGADLAALEADLARHRAWLESMNTSLSWRLTAPLRTAKRRARRALKLP